MANHYYTKTGEPMHWVPKKDGNGNRPTTIADARRLGLLPSVTTVLEVLDKPALNDWRTMQAVMAVLTAPKLDGETIDAFVERVLHGERQQDAEAQAARDRGTEIHAALEAMFSKRSYDVRLGGWIEPAADIVYTLSEQVRIMSSEFVLVGDGYAGRTDLIVETAPEETVWVIDFKTAKTIPKPDKNGEIIPWPEHRMQLGAYAMALQRTHEANGLAREIRVANVYISTVDIGRCVLAEDKFWDKSAVAFSHALAIWKHLKGYEV